jgi:hypothetical protein
MSANARARPKSVILTRCTPFSKRMLAGSMSRRMIPWAGREAASRMEAVSD